MTRFKNASSMLGLVETESKQVFLFLQKLLLYVHPRNFVIVGGLAIRYYVTHFLGNYPTREFNDLDIAVQDIFSISSGITNEFLVYHFHRHDRKHFYIALVDSDTKIKVDIFDSSFWPFHLMQIKLGELTLPFQSVEDQLVKTVFDIQRTSEKSKVDPKQFSDTNLLVQIADMKVANEYWQKRKLAGYPKTIYEAIIRAEKIAKKHPDWLQEKPFRRKEPYSCAECVEDENFPITPMPEIYRLLGYVE